MEEEQLSGQQYETILKYMQATSEQDFQAAKLLLKEYNFNLNTAINARFNQNQRPLQRNRRIPDNEESDEQVVGKFIQHVQKQNENWSLIGSTFDFVKNFTIGLVKFLSEIILPQALLKKFLRSRFYVLYKDEIRVQIKDEKLVTMLENTKDKTHKACFLVVSPDQKCPCIVQILTNPQIVKKIKQQYLFYGTVQNDSQLGIVPNIHPPQIIICRFNVYNQLITLRAFTGQQQIRQLTPQLLNTLLDQSRNLCKRDKNVLIKYRNFLRRQYYGQMHVEEEEEEEINLVRREEATHHIREQNEEYKKLEEMENKRLTEIREEEERKRREMEMLQEVQEERKVRKMSIPDEPIDGEIIRFSFRCPDGTNISRNFHADEKVEILYHWVQTNDQIQLEDNKKRAFQILYSYPPTPLKDVQDKLLKQVFESDSQKLLIRQL